MADKQVIRQDVVQITWDVEDSPLGKITAEAKKFQSSVGKAVGTSENGFSKLTKSVKETQKQFKGATSSGNKFKSAIKNIGTATLTKVQTGLTKIKTGFSNGITKAKGMLAVVKDLGNENLSKLSSSLDNVVKKLGSGMVNAAKKAARALVGITVAGGAGVFKMTDMASDLSETLNKVDVSFGSNSGEVKKWAKSSITSMGLAEQTALDMAALFGDMGTGMGISQKEASKMSMNMTQLGADLASFKNMDIAEVTTALNGVFTGETESLKRLGIVMTQTNLEAFAMAKGLKKPLKEMSESELVMLRYEYVLSKTKNAQGDFARTGGGFANQLRMAKEQLKQIGTTVGGVFIGGFEKALKKVNTFGAELNTKLSEVFADGFQFSDIAQITPMLGSVGTVIQKVADKIRSITSNSEKMGKIKAVFTAIKGAVGQVVNFVGKLASKITDFVTSAGFLNTVKAIVDGVSKVFGFLSKHMDAIINVIVPLAAGFVALVGTVKAISTGIKIWSGVQWVLNSGLLACPITWIVLGIAALVAAIVVLVMHWDKVKAVALKCWNAIKTAFGKAASWFSTTVIEPLKSFFTNLWYFIVGICAYIWEGLCAAFAPIASWVNANVIQPVKTFFTGLWNKVKSGVTSVWNSICSVWGVISGWVSQNVVEPVKSFFGGLWDTITTKVGEVKETIIGAFQTAWDKVTGIWNGITGFFSDLWDGVKNVVGKIIGKGKEATGNSKKADNNYRGGMITSPTLSWVGEKGAEMIIPLTGYKKRAMSLWRQAGNMLGANVSPTVSLPSYSPASSVSTVSNSSSQTNNYSPQFTLNLSGTVDRTTERTVKQWVREALEETFDSMSRTSPRLTEV